MTGDVGVATGAAPDALADNTAAKTDATEIPDKILSMAHSLVERSRSPQRPPILPQFSRPVTRALGGR